MNKLLIMIMAATLIIAGCSDKQEASSDQAEPSAVEKSMDSATGAMSDMAAATGDAMDSTAEMASNAAESASEMTTAAADSVTETASDIKESAGEMVADASEAVSGMSDGGATGLKVYQGSCQGCHATGAAGAPKLGDTVAWAPRIAAGMDALYTNSINGKGIMPPKGTCMACSDDDLKAAVDYMVSNSK